MGAQGRQREGEEEGARAKEGAKGGWLAFVKQLWGELRDDAVMMLSASVAFYAALSLAPMVLLFVSLTGFIGKGTQERMIDTVTSAVGDQASASIRTLATESAGRMDKAGVGLAIGLAVVLFSASRVMVGLQIGLNRVWHVRATRGAGWKNWIRTRLLSMGMVLGVAFLLLVSMVASTVIEMILPAGAWAWNLATIAISFGVFTLLFAAIFKVLPDVRIAWRDVWIGGIVTAALFSVGKYLVGLYLARAGYATSYGVAGSLIVMLVWVYYSAAIVFVGSEITQVYAQRAGRPIEPDKHAVRVEEVEQGREGRPAPA